MASNYPGSLDSFDTIASDKKTSDVVGGRTHRDMHNDLGDAIEAVQNVLGTDPAGSFSTVKARLDALVAYAEKTGAYTATVADHTLNVTSGTFTLALPAASTCAGQSLRVKNSGTGVVTLDGDGSETVDAGATFPLGPRSYVEITSTGSAWVVTGGVPDTGWRDIGSLLLNSWSYVGSAPVIRRVGARVTLDIGYRLTGASASSDHVLDVPSGFRRNDTLQGGFFTAGVLMANSNSGIGASSGSTDLIPAGFDGIVGSTHGLVINSTNLAITGTLSWITVDSWPTSLPGTAA